MHAAADSGAWKLSGGGCCEGGEGETCGERSGGGGGGAAERWRGCMLRRRPSNWFGAPATPPLPPSSWYLWGSEDSRESCCCWSDDIGAKRGALRAGRWKANASSKEGVILLSLPRVLFSLPRVRAGPRWCASGGLEELRRRGGRESAESGHGALVFAFLSRRSRVKPKKIMKNEERGGGASRRRNQKRDVFFLDDAETPPIGPFSPSFPARTKNGSERHLCLARSL